MSVNSWSDTSINITIPSSATTGNVVVTVGGLASNGVQFTVTLPAPGPPVISGLSPSSGPVTTSVTISGTNFDSFGTVTFNGIAATPTNWSASSIVVRVPSGATTGNVVVTTAAGASNGVTFTVTTTAPPPPVLTAISPTSATASATVNVTLTGSGLTGATAVTASGGISVSNIVVVSDTSVTATFTLPSTATASSVTVATPTGTSNAVTFTVTAAVVSPPTGGTTFQLVSITGGLTITGGTYAGQAGISLFCTTAWSPSVTLAVGDSVYVQGTGSYDGYFILAGISPNPDDFGMTLAAGSNTNTVEVLQQGSIILGGTPGTGGGGGTAPNIASLAPATGPAGTGVIVAGSHFGTTQGTSTVAFNGILATVTSWSDTSIDVAVPATASTGNVVVTTANGPSNGVTFTVTPPSSAPTLTSISPVSAAANTASVMTFAGSNFTGATAINYAGTGITTANLTVSSATSMSSTFGISASASSGNVSVTSPSGTSNTVPFTVSAVVPPAAPLIQSINPMSSSAGLAPTVMLSGSGFVGAPSVAPTTVSYSGSGGTVSNVVVVNDTTITMTLTLASGATSGILTVTTPIGTSNGAASTVSGQGPPATPQGYLAFVFGGTANGIYVGLQTNMPSTLAIGNSVSIIGTGTYDGTYTVAAIASVTDLFLNPGSNSATVIVSKQGLISFP